MALVSTAYKQDRDINGLTAKEAQFATLLSKGCTGAEAYRLAYDSNAKPESVWTEASKIRARPEVRQRVQELLAQARLHDMDSIGEAILRTKELIQQAAEHKNYSAAMKGNSDLLKMHGLLRDTLVVQWEASLTDAQLVDRLAQGDPALAEAAQKLLRAPSSFAEVTQRPIIDVNPEEPQE